MASASGLALLAEEDKDPLRTSTVGFGELIAHALETAPALRKLVLCIGGSATSDGGVGMATALGFRFLDADGNVIEKGSPMHDATVVGDTVGDPFKDTAGPSLHVLVKLLSTITLVLAPVFI